MAMINTEWEIYDIEDTVSGKIVAGRICHTHLGKFRRLQKNEQTLTYEYVYESKELTPKDYWRFVNSKKKYEYWKFQSKNAQRQRKRLKGFHKKMSQLLGNKYLNPTWKPSRNRVKRQKFVE